MEVQWKNIAEAAYEKYMQNKSKEPFKPFEELEPLDRSAWITAIQYACYLYGVGVTT